MQLAHLSDIHVFAMGRLRPWRFLNKRILGGTNLLLHRRKAHGRDLAQRALDKVVELGVDHICVSGDLTNLALVEEFDAARDLLDAVPGAPHNLSVVPGNHDYYVRSAAKARRFETTFESYLKSDLPEYQLPSRYPYCHIRGEAAVIGLNSGIPTPYFVSGGRVDPDELEAACRMLDDPRLDGLLKVVMVHHHVLPFEHTRTELPRRMFNAELVLRRLRQHDADMIIHGHNHFFQIHEVPQLRGDGTVLICEPGSAVVAKASRPEKVGKFNVYDIEGGRLQAIRTYIWDDDAQDFVPWRARAFDDHPIGGEPAPEPAPERHEWTIDELASGLGVALKHGEGHHVARRGAHALELDLAGRDLQDPLVRRDVWGDLAGLRLGADSIDAEWSPEKERDPAPDRVYHKNEVPSVHGERHPRMLPTRAVQTWAELTGAQALGEEWALDDEVFKGHVLELGNRLHMLSEGEAAQTAQGAERLAADAVRALFYQSYKVRPRETHDFPWGTLKVYATTEGLGASRVLLLPDYDWDVARAKGWAAIPSRDELIVAQPRGPEHREDARLELERETFDRFERARYPLSRVILSVDEDGAGHQDVGDEEE